MITQPQQMELDAIRELVKTLEADSAHIPTITLTTKMYSFENSDQNRTFDVWQITATANGKVISYRCPGEQYYYELVSAKNGGICDEFFNPYQGSGIQWSEGTNTFTYDMLSTINCTGYTVIYYASDAMNNSVPAHEPISLKLSDYGYDGTDGSTLTVKLTTTVVTV